MSRRLNRYIKQLDLNLAPLKRQTNANKGTHGSVAVIGGQDGMHGALLLASRTAVLCGTGRVYAFSLSSNPLMVDPTFPEVMYRNLSELAELSKSIDAFVIGPGLGKQPLAITWLEFCMALTRTIIVDADALNLIAENPDLAKLAFSRQADTIFTPHPGEAARLLHETIDMIQNNRTFAAQAITKQFNCICVLKGADSVCANQGGDYWINPTGNPGLATAGTGDVLAGLIGALVAQGLSALDALRLGVYLHGLAADKLVEKGVGPIGLTASEVALEIRQLLNTVDS